MLHSLITHYFFLIFICLSQVSVAALGILSLCCGMHAGSLAVACEPLVGACGT